MIQIENKDRTNQVRLGQMPTIDAEEFLLAAKEFGSFEAELHPEGYRHAIVWLVEKSDVAMAFYAGWKAAKTQFAQP